VCANLRGILWPLYQSRPRSFLHLLPRDSVVSDSGQAVFGFGEGGGSTGGRSAGLEIAEALGISTGVVLFHC
jgi:hypothetical protein